MTSNRTSGGTWLRSRIGQFLPQPLIGSTTGILALAAIVVAWIVTLPSLQSVQPYNGGIAFSDLGKNQVVTALSVTLVSLALLVAVVASIQFPIHIRRHAKVIMTSVPLYLMAVLLPPPLAATTAALGVLTGEFVSRKQRGLFLSDIASAAGRYTFVALLSAMVAHLSSSVIPHSLVLMAAAVVAWVVDMVTVPLLLGPMCGERPAAIIPMVIQESCVSEGAQYVLGLLGALAAIEQPWAIVLLALPTALVYYALKNAKEMHDSTRELLVSMADTVDLRDPYTGGHSRRVTDYSVAILRELNVTGPEAELIISAARVHDIGKIAIPDAVLNKPGPLTPEERAVMESHPERGADVLQKYADFARGVDIVRHHHESWDGTGYPHRLKADDIPFGARVVAVADTYDAMTSNRPYRAGMPVAKAASILRQGRGQQWDAAIVDAFLRSIADLLEQPAPPILRVVPAQPQEATLYETRRAV